MKVQLIIGSTRPGRIGSQIAQWMFENLPQREGLEYEIVDLLPQNLPMLDEETHPSMNQYEHEHTKAWSQKIKEADAFIFLTPEYNAGYPAALKNAIDYLYHEWRDKPVMIVSYGIGGGGSAATQLRQVAERLKMRPTKDNLSFTVTPDLRGEDGQIKDINTVFAQYVTPLQDTASELLDAQKDNGAIGQ